MGIKKLSPKRREVLVNFLKKHVDEINDGLQQRVDNIREAYRQWESVTSGIKTFPWPGASNVRMPIEAIIRDSITARLLNALQGTDRDIQVEALVNKRLPIPNPAKPNAALTWQDIADRLEAYMLNEASEGGAFDLRQYETDLIDESSLSGTGVSKWWWHTEASYSDETSVLPTLSEGNIKTKVCRLENFVFAKGYEKLDNIPFVGEKYTLRPSEMLANVDALGWDKSEVKRYLEKHASESADAEGTVPSEDDIEGGVGSEVYSSGEQWICEAWVRIALDSHKRGDDEGYFGREVRVVVEFAWENPEFIFRVMDWPYEHGRTPFPDPVPYIKRRGLMLGMGIPERVREMSTAISTNLNQIIDGATLANVPAFSINEQVPGLRNLSRVRPGQVIPRGDDASNFKPEKLGAVGPDVFQAHNLIRQTLEQVSKVSDFNLGRDMQGAMKDSTATGMLAMMAETGQYFDQIARVHRKHITSGLNLWHGMMCQTQPVERVEQVLGRDDAEILSAVWSLPTKAVLDRLKVKVTFANTAATRELTRQEEMAKWQILQSYYQILVQFGQMLMQAPVMKPLLDEIVKSMERKLSGLLEKFGEAYTNTGLPDWDSFSQVAVQMMQAQQAQAGGMTSEPGQSPAETGEAPEPEATEPPVGAGAGVGTPGGPNVGGGGAGA